MRTNETISPLPTATIMDSTEFSETRKRLEKTQRELATLLGVSLKAVCSYEQGWRTVPTHIERQMIFLLTRKKNKNQEIENCWDVKKCPEEKKQKCPAWEFDSGEFCWFLCGTLCDNATHQNWQEKITVCKDCEVMQNLKK